MASLPANTLCGVRELAPAVESGGLSPRPLTSIISELDRSPLRDQ
jgi:hypothetical protein